VSEKLPDYMIPASFIALDSLPLTPNGKINRRLLPPPDRARPALETPMVAPGNAVESELAQIWAEVLALDEVGIRDNFFDLGGDSLSAGRIVASVLTRFQLEIPLKALFQSPTVAEMAMIVAEHQDKKIASEDLKKLLAELESMTDEEAAQLVSENRAETSKN
jgi:acyl carrier protein